MHACLVPNGCGWGSLAVGAARSLVKFMRWGRDLATAGRWSSVHSPPIRQERKPQGQIGTFPTSAPTPTGRKWRNERLSAKGWLAAWANLYGEFAVAIEARRTGRTIPVGLLNHPTVEDGARGVQFIEAVVASHNAGGTKPRLRSRWGNW